MNVAPRDLLIDLLTRNLPAGGPDVTLISVTVSAPGYHREVRVEDHNDARFSSLARMTAFPTTALVDMVATGTNRLPGRRSYALGGRPGSASIPSWASWELRPAGKNQLNGVGLDH